MSARSTSVALMGLIAAGCVSEGPAEPIETPDPIIVVQGVLRTDQSQQWILVERTLNGTGQAFTGGFVPGSGVPVPLEGATVTLSNLSFPADPCGASVTLLESAAPPNRAQPGAYWTGSGCPTLRAGDTVEVVIRAGADEVRGRTEIPGTNAVMLSAGGKTVSVPGPVLAFNRDVDTLQVTVDPSHGRSLLVEVHDRLFVETGSYLAYESSQVWVDGASLTLPGNVSDAFAAELDLGDALPDLFNAGRTHTVTVAFADQNFYDQIRSGNNPVTGRGFINSIDGGIGYLGSMAVDQSYLRVVAEADDDREGTYRMTGTVGGSTVDLQWELYLNREDYRGGTPLGAQPFSGFVAGTWTTGAYDAWTRGSFLAGRSMQTFLAQPTGGTNPDGTPEVEFWELRGTLPTTGTSSVGVTFEGNPVGTLVVTKS